MTATDEQDDAAAQPDDAYEGMVVFWHIRTPDTGRARSFFGELFGWQFQEINPLTFAVLNRGRLMGCVVESKDSAQAVPGSVLYVHVNDLPSTLKRATELGAEVVADPLNITGTKAFADLRDPTGMVFGLWTETYEP